jgi:regulator of protease activity HflC (stomatin/prohibitin superfamily)
MLYLIIAGIVAIIFLLALVAAFVTRKSDSSERISFWVPAGVLVFLGLVSLVFSFTTVDARAVGIQTAFGKYDRTLNSGAQLTAPWASVEEFTTRLKPADLDGDQGVGVTFKGGGSGKVNSNFQWAISSDDGNDGAKLLWEKYRDFDTVQAFVLRAGRDSILNVSNDYTPNEARTKQDEIAIKVKAHLGATLSKYGIVLDSVSILSMPLDARTQASLDKIVAAQNDEETALSQERRAATDARTAKLREAAGALSPAANQRYCLEVANSWDVTKNGTLPATFSCGFGGNTPVIVGNK